MSARADQNLHAQSDDVATRHAPPPLVSIVAASRNEAAYVRASLDSFLNQDYPPDRLEVLIADGESTDGTREQIAQYAQRDPRVRWVANPKRIKATGINRAIAESRGEIIVLMDFHVVYAPSYVRMCVEHLQRGAADNVGGVIDTQPGADTRMARAIAAMLSHPFGVGGSRFRTTQRSGYVHTVPFGAFFRRLIDEVGPFDERMTRSMDNEFNNRLLASGRKIFLTPDIRSTYFARPTLRQLSRQAFINGFWHIATLVVEPRGFTWRYFVPFVFVLSLLCGPLALLWTPLAWIAVASFSAYVLAAVIAAIDVKRRHSQVSFWMLPLVFFCYHVVYGSATLLGLLCLPRTWWTFRRTTSPKKSLVEAVP